MMMIKLTLMLKLMMIIKLMMMIKLIIIKLMMMIKLIIIKLMMTLTAFTYSKGACSETASEVPDRAGQLKIRPESFA